MQTHFICFHRRHGQFLLLHGKILREFGNRFARLHQLVETFTNTRVLASYGTASHQVHTHYWIYTGQTQCVTYSSNTHSVAHYRQYIPVFRTRPTTFLHAQLFSWVLAIRTQVLLLVQQTLYPLRHLPSPRFCLVPILLFPTRWLFLTSKQHSGTVTHTWHSEPRTKRAINHGARQRNGLCSQTDLVFHQAKGHLLTWPTFNN